MQPPAEHVHWLFATGFLLLALCLLARAIVGDEVWSRRAWRAYLWPSLLFGLGVLMWPVMVLFTNSTIHMVAHGAWAQTMMLAGAPAVGGTLIGSTVVNPETSAFLLGLGVGAIAQVIVQIAPSLRDRSSGQIDPATYGGLAAGALLMYATGLLVVV